MMRSFWFERKDRLGQLIEAQDMLDMLGLRRRWFLANSTPIGV
jgi:hypothetical protein